MGLDSRQATEDEKQELKLQEDNLIIDLLNSDDGLEAKLQKWAQIVEELINHNHPDYNFAVNQISSYIRKKCHEKHMKCAHNVNRYLSDKYKDANMVRIHHVEDQLEVALCTQSEYKSIQEYSTMELEFELEYLEKTDNDTDKLLMLVNQRKDDIIREGIRRGIKLCDREYRPPIQCKDYRYDIPDYFGLQELNQEVINQGNRWIRALQKFFNVKYPARPAVVRQKAWQYANSLRTVANLYETINEDKWSGDKSFWFEREYCAKIQSKHDAGNSTMFPTTLCYNCSKDVANDPKDCVKMMHWRPSPTGFICPFCKGTKIKERENTREQVGDKEADVYRDASDVLNYMNDYPDIFIDYAKHFKSPEIYSRKTAIAGKFSRSAIAGVDEIVIPEKKEK